MVIASALLAHFGAVILLSLLFSRGARSPIATTTLLIGFVVTIAVAGFTIARAERFSTLSLPVRRLQDTAGLLQETSLPFIVAATQIGLILQLIQRSMAAALVAAGLLPVVAFPGLAMVLAKPKGISPSSQPLSAIPVRTIDQ